MVEQAGVKRDATTISDASGGGFVQRRGLYSVERSDCCGDCGGWSSGSAMENRRTQNREVPGTSPGGVEEGKGTGEGIMTTIVGAIVRRVRGEPSPLILDRIREISELARVNVQKTDHTKREGHG